ncbi:MAG TPA: hypothetical protein VGG64_00545 [Pirellulales bacterium]|jgi:hypothetical protein
MAVNRLAGMFAEHTVQPASQPNVVPVGFVMCPVFIVQIHAVQQVNAIQALYRQAYEQAQAKARLTRLEKRFFSTWN